MSAPPYMPLFVGDYLADTTHLSRAEHGAYMLLLMAMWRAGGKLPNDRARLARLAKCTSQEWTECKDVIMEFFQISGPHITHRRLAREIERYTSKVTNRSKAGKASAEKRRFKINELAPTGVDHVLNMCLPDVAASGRQPEPEPEPQPEPDHISYGAKAPPVSTAPPSPSPIEGSSPMGGHASDARALHLGALAGGEDAASARAKAAARAEAAKATDDLVNDLWMAQPRLGERRRATRPDVKRALISALKRGGKPADIRRAVLAYYALPDSTKEGGKYAMGADRLLELDRWKEFLDAPEARPPTPMKTWDGPSEIREAVVRAKSDPWAVSHLDVCHWDGEARAIVSPRRFYFDRLRTEVGYVLDRLRVGIELRQ